MAARTTDAPRFNLRLDPAEKAAWEAAARADLGLLAQPEFREAWESWVSSGRPRLAQNDTCAITYP